MKACMFLYDDAPLDVFISRYGWRDGWRRWRIERNLNKIFRLLAKRDRLLRKA